MKTNTQAVKVERIILALLEHGSHEKAAAALGISTATVRRWLQKPEFQAQYRKAKPEVFPRSMGYLQHAAEEAVTTLVQIMHDKQEPAASRVRAADSVLNHAHSFALEDLQARVEALEQTQKEPAE